MRRVKFVLAIAAVLNPWILQGRCVGEEPSGLEARAASKVIGTVPDGLNVPPFLIRIGPEGRWTAFGARKGEKGDAGGGLYSVLNGEVTGPWQSLGTTTFLGGGEAAVREWGTEQGTFVSVGKKEWGPFNRARALFSRDRGRVVFLVQADGKDRLIRDGDLEEAYDDIDGVAISDDGLTVAHAAESGHEECVVVNGAKGETFDHAGHKWVWLTPDGKHLAYIASRGDATFLVRDGEKTPVPAGARSPVLSPDGSRCVYWTRDGETWTPVIDSKSRPECDRVGLVRFSPDSARLAYVSSRSGKATLVVDDRPAVECTSVHSFVFSPDGKRYAARIQRDAGEFVVVDGREHGPYAMGDPHELEEPLFSPDGAQVAWAALRWEGPNSPHRWVACLDEVDGPEFDLVTGLTFSPDGKHFAYTGRNFDRGDSLVLDGQAERLGDTIQRIDFASSGLSVGVGVVRGREILWLDIPTAK